MFYFCVQTVSLSISVLSLQVTLDSIGRCSSGGKGQCHIALELHKRTRREKYAQSVISAREQCVECGVCVCVWRGVACVCVCVSTA